MEFEKELDIEEGHRMVGPDPTSPYKKGEVVRKNITRKGGWDVRSVGSAKAFNFKSDLLTDISIVIEMSPQLFTSEGFVLMFETMQGVKS